MDSSPSPTRRPCAGGVPGVQARSVQPGEGGEAGGGTEKEEEGGEEGIRWKEGKNILTHLSA